jgi:hypothetical protein
MLIDARTWCAVAIFDEAASPGDQSDSLAGAIRSFQNSDSEYVSSMFFRNLNTVSVMSRIEVEPDGSVS